MDIFMVETIVEVLPIRHTHHGGGGAGDLFLLTGFPRGMVRVQTITNVLDCSKAQPKHWFLGI